MLIKDERGSGTVLSAGLALAMLLLMVFVVALGQAAVAASKAATAADLAALAAADTYRGLMAGDPCQTAGETAQQHGAALVACTLNADMSATVEVSVATTLPWLAHGQARAGPPPADVLPGQP